MAVVAINRKSGIPLYVQLKQQIYEHIKQSAWPPGYKLPTERELALIVGVSRNTVSMAYKELAEEGVLVSHQGRGTFVASLSKTPSKKHLLTLIDQALDEATKMNFHLDRFVELIKERAVIRQNNTQVKIAFIECNREQVDYFAKQIELGSGVMTLPLVLSELHQMTEHQWHDLLEDIDLVVTTFFHIHEVRNLIGNSSLKVVGIALEPELETIVKIAMFEKEQKVGMVCISEIFAEKVFQAIENAGITNLKFDYTIAKQPEVVAEFIKDCGYLLTSPGRKKEIINLVSKDVEVVEFIYRPDTASINLLQDAVIESSSTKRRDCGE